MSTYFYVDVSKDEYKSWEARSILFKLRVVKGDNYILCFVLFWHAHNIEILATDTKIKLLNFYFLGYAKLHSNILLYINGKGSHVCGLFDHHLCFRFHNIGTLIHTKTVNLLNSKIYAILMFLYNLLIFRFCLHSHFLNWFGIQ